MMPMLAEQINEKDLDHIRYPVLGSRKMDGIRGLMVNGTVLSRSLKPIPNQNIKETLRAAFANLLPDVMVDGEITAGATFQDCTSIVMSKSPPLCNFTYHVFDCVSLNNTTETFLKRLERLRAVAKSLDYYPRCTIEVLEQRLLRNKVAVLEYEQELLDDGAEGVILRSLTSPYKYGRSTLREGYLLKLKRFETKEAVIIDFEQLERNLNEAKVDERGYTKRSSHKAGKVLANELGSFVVKDAEGVVFNVGSGFTKSQRMAYWIEREKYRGKTIVVKYFNYNIKDAARIPSFAGFRHPEDL